MPEVEQLVSIGKVEQSRTDPVEPGLRTPCQEVGANSDSGGRHLASVPADSVVHNSGVNPWSFVERFPIANVRDNGRYLSGNASQAQPKKTTIRLIF